MQTSTPTAAIPSADVSANVAATVAVIKRLNLANAIKELNNTPAKGDFHIRVRHDREWNELHVLLIEGKDERAKAHIDLGHTNESRADAIAEARGTITNFLADPK
jgi:hypothetical protein